MEPHRSGGAFDPMNPTRSSFAASLGAALELGEQGAKYANQSSLFGGGDGAPGAFALTRVPAWSERERLQNEKQSLGFYLSGHPFSAYRDELRRFARTPLANIAPQQESVMLAGVIYGVQVRNSRRGRMAILTLDDGSARVEVVVFGELFHEKRAVIQEDQVVVVKGRVFADEFSGGLRITADQGRDLAEARGAARLVVTGRRRAELEKVASEVVAEGGAAPAIVAHDALAADYVEAVAAACGAAFGTVDVLVNNAGGSRAFGKDATEEQWQEALTLNFTPHRQLTNPRPPGSQERKWGRVINITG